ncbi:MAG: peptidyl-prolyl cis-trans isomerase [Alphaproteobacteria bacterium]|uniref:Periplasmic chaperone PpiD n=1 Tax=Candidatus Nitrobium versatile TaxID=2884831 RepID=A0A953LZZ9_9BACT|nr:peptidyl-prolyl cis-trans isomerase [Candidatus Nitrobium versatile]
MLTFMRRNAGSLFIKILLGAVALSFMAFFGPSLDLFGGRSGAGGASGMAEDTVATVGDMRITRAEFLDQVERMKDTYRQMGFGQQTDFFNSPMFLRSILANLVDRAVLAQAAVDMGITATDAEVAAQLRRSGAFMVNGTFSRDRYLGYIRRTGQAMDEYENNLRMQIAAQKLASLLQASVFVTDEELWDTYTAENDKISIEVMRLTAEDAPDVEIDDEELRTAYEANPEAYREPEKRKLRYLYVQLQDFALQTQVSDEDINAFYAEHQSEFETPEQVRYRRVFVPTGDDAAAARARADEAQKKAAAGEDFAALVGKYSDDEANAAVGGDVGWRVKRPGPDAPEIEAAFALEENGVSGVIELPTGFSVVQTTGKREAGVRPLEEISEQIELQVQAQKAREKMKQVAGEAVAKITPDTDLDDFTIENDDWHVDDTDYFAKGEPIEGLEKAQDVARMAFEMAPGETTQPFEGFSRVYIFRLTDVKESRVPSFKEAKAAVRESLIDEKKKLALAERAKAALEELRNGETTWSAAASKLGVTPTVTGDFASDALSVPKIGTVPGLVDAAFAVPPGESYPKEIVESSEGAVIFRVVSRVTPSREQFEAGKEEYRAKTLDEKTNRFLQTWVEARRDEYPVAENQQFWGRMATTGGAQG